MKTYIKIIDSLSETIIDAWCKEEEVVKIFSARNVSVDIFKSHFASRILKYQLSVLKNEQLPGQCPTIAIMLEFFKHKKFQLDEIYRICDLLKKNILLALLEKDVLTKKVIESIFWLISENFSGVIREYLELNYTQKQDTTISTTPTTEKEITTEANLQQIQPIKQSEGYIPEEALIEESDMEVIEEICEEIDRYIDNCSSSRHTNEDTHNYAQNLEKLGSRLDAIGLTTLGRSLSDTSISIKDNLDIYELNLHMVLFLLESIANDLSLWRQALKNASDTNGIEYSLVSNLEQFNMLITWLSSQHQ